MHLQPHTPVADSYSIMKLDTLHITLPVEPEKHHAVFETLASRFSSHFVDSGSLSPYLVSVGPRIERTLVIKNIE